jgi:hypothetical protein
MAVLEPYKHGYYLWKYLPSVAGAVICCLLFAIGTGAHIWRIWKTRTWMGIAFAIGGFSRLQYFLLSTPFLPA